MYKKKNKDVFGRKENQFGIIHGGIYEFKIPPDLLNIKLKPGSMKAHRSEYELKALSIVLYGFLKQKANNTTNIAKVTRDQMSRSLFINGEHRKLLDKIINILEAWGMKVLPKHFKYTSKEGMRDGYGYDLTGILEKIKWKTPESEEEMMSRVMGYVNAMPQNIRDSYAGLIDRSFHLDPDSVETLKEVYEDWLAHSKQF